MQDGRDQHRFLKGAVAGMIGGLVASWAMNRFQAAVSKAAGAWEKSAHRPERQEYSTSSGSEPATTALAQRMSRFMLRRELTPRERKIADPLVHYGYGTLAGALYGVMAELRPKTTLGAGAAYGTALWLGGDEVAVPKLGLSKAATQYPAKVHLKALASHIVYGFTAEKVRRGVRGLL